MGTYFKLKNIINKISLKYFEVSFKLGSYKGGKS